MSNVKNYTEQGGEKTVIGGTLEVTAQGKIIIAGTELSAEGVKGDPGEKGDPGDPGVVTPAVFQANSIATDTAGLVADFNSLLGKLITAGLMAAE